MSKCLANSVACSADIFLFPFAIERIEGSLSPIFSATIFLAAFLDGAGIELINAFKFVIPFIVAKRYAMYLFQSSKNTKCGFVYIDTFCIFLLTMIRFVSIITTNKAEKQ